jgi:hypothetical protein
LNSDDRNNYQNSSWFVCVDGVAHTDLQKTQIQKTYTAVFCQYSLQNRRDIDACVCMYGFG